VIHTTKYRVRPLGEAKEHLGAFGDHIHYTSEQDFATVKVALATGQVLSVYPWALAAIATIAIWFAHQFFILVVILAGGVLALVWRGVLDNMGRSLESEIRKLGTAGRYAEAVPLAKRAVELRKRLGERHVEYAVSATDLARIYERLGEFDKAEPLYRQTLELRRRELAKSTQTTPVLYATWDTYIAR
jgi:tetratricopeptide (TPR) repeat protein